MIVVDRAQDGRLGLASAVGMVIVERRRKSLVLTRLSRLGLDQTRPDQPLPALTHPYLSAERMSRRTENVVEMSMQRTIESNDH